MGLRKEQKRKQKLQLNSLPIKNLQEGSFVEPSSLMPLITGRGLLWFWVTIVKFFVDVFFVLLHSCAVQKHSKGPGTAKLGSRLSDKCPELWVRILPFLFVVLHLHGLHAFLQGNADSKEGYSERYCSESPYSSNMDPQNKRSGISLSLDEFPSKFVLRELSNRQTRSRKGR